MVATKRNAKGDATQLLSFDQKKEASSTNNKRMGFKKKGLFSVFQKKTAATDYEPLLPTAPSTPETPMSVTVVSHEYDPTCAYRLSSSDTMISGLTERDNGAIASTPRRVGFAPGSGTGTPSHPNKTYKDDSVSLEERETTLTPVDEETKTTMTPTVAGEGDKPLEGTKPSWANQTLGFFDEICNAPKVETHKEEGDVPILLNAERPQWGTAPSEDDESTYASLQSTVDDSKSTMDHTYNTQTGTNSTRGTTTANNQSVEVPNRKPVVPQQQLEKSPSHDHENFEVVLDTSVLGSNSPQRRGWFTKKDDDDDDDDDEEELETEQNDTHEAAALESMAAEARGRSPPRKSLVKRLFSGRKVKKNDEVAAEKARELARQESLRGTVFLENVPTEPRVEESSQELAEEEPVRELSAIEEDNEDAQDTSTWGSLMGTTLDAMSVEDEPGLIKLVERSFEDPEVVKAEEPEEEINLNESIEVAKEEPQSTVKDKKEKKHKSGLSLGLLKIGKGVKGVVSKLKSISHDDSSSTKSSAKSASISKPSAAAVPLVKQKKQKPTWKAVVDPNSGRTYYYHRKTRETTWRKPEELKKLEAELNSAASDYTPTHKNGDVEANTTPSRDVPNASGGNSPLPSHGQEARYKTPERATKPDSKQETPGESPIKPPLVIDAAVSAESQQRISRAEQGMLGASFEEADDLQSPARANHFDDTWEKKKEIERLLTQLPQPDNGSMDQLLKNCEGKEELLLKQLRDKVESQPFDEPFLDEAPSPIASPPRMSARTTTYMSKASATTKSSTITDKTQRIKNTLKGKNVIETISENQSAATSISSHHDSEDHLMPSSRGTQYNNDYRIPSKVPVPRERSLNVEELTNSRVAAETFDSRGRVVRSGRDYTEKNVDGSYFGDNEEDDTYGTDSVSALSEADVDFSHRKENFETARRRALDDAIEREDWELAAALSEGMRAAHSTGDFAKAHSSWNQSELDKFIANNDWDAVKSYIARMREAKKEALEDPLPPIDRTSAGMTIPVVKAPSRAIPVVKAPSRGNPVVKASSRSSPSLASSSRTPASSSGTPSLVRNPGPERGQGKSLTKRIGSRSQLQHKQLMSAESSWTSDSYDSEESYDSEYS